MTTTTIVHAVPDSGVIVPMITPLSPGGGVDTDSTARLATHLIDAGVRGLLVLGSSGENAALSAGQRRDAVACVADAAQGRAHVMAGVASLGTADAEADGQEFSSLGADSLLVPAPFGFHLSSDELAGHFGAVADRSGSPVVAYEVPSRVGVSLDNDLLIRLATDGTISGVKDSSGNLGAARLRSHAFHDHGLAGLPHFTGSEECIDGFLLGGGSGCIPGLANVFPEFHVRLCQHAAAGDWAAAAEVQDTIVSLVALYFHDLPRASFSAQFFAIVKEALVQRGVIASNTSSVPFTQADDQIPHHVTALLAKADALRHD